MDTEFDVTAPEWAEAPPWLSARLALITEAGSHAYGLNTPESDLDLRGIALEPIDHVVGFTKKFEQYQKHTDAVDVCVFGLVKFCALAAQCNPNVLELLFVRDESVRHRTLVYDELRRYRGLFLSQKARHTFRGYAMSQLKKIRFKAEHGSTGKRKAVIEEFGWDVKHGMHLVRLMRMGEELLRDGVLNVWRDDREELLAVRSGQWPLEDVIAWAEAKDIELKDMPSSLPWGPPLEEIDRLCRNLLLASWRINLRVSDG